MRKKILAVLFSVVVIFNHLPLFSQSKPEPLKLSDPDSYTWILLPDPQTYQKFGRNQALFQLMTDWIIDQKENLNIKMVLCTGDLVEQNNLLVPDGKNGDQSSVKQWEAAQRGFSKLNNNIPYILCTGNHDYGVKSAENRYSQLNSYFPPQGNPLTQSLLVELAARSKYQDHIGVLLTHSYINSKGKRTHLEKYPLNNANYGEEIWNDFVQPSKNIQFVFSGHIADSESHLGQVGFRVDKNQGGVNVNQMLFNAQREGGGWHGNGGDGWLRILEFLPNKHTVKVSTFSPLFWISPSTRSLAQRTEGFGQFIISYQ